MAPGVIVTRGFGKMLEEAHSRQMKDPEYQKDPKGYIRRAFKRSMTRGQRSGERSEDRQRLERKLTLTPLTRRQ
jgi:hypothetical protein